MILVVLFCCRQCKRKNERETIFIFIQYAFRINRFFCSCVWVAKRTGGPGSSFSVDRFFGCWWLHFFLENNSQCSKIFTAPPLLWIGHCRRAHWRGWLQLWLPLPKSSNLTSPPPLVAHSHPALSSRYCWHCWYWCRFQLLLLLLLLSLLLLLLLQVTTFEALWSRRCGRWPGASIRPYC